MIWKRGSLSSPMPASSTPASSQSSLSHAPKSINTTTGTLGGKQKEAGRPASPPLTTTDDDLPPPPTPGGEEADD